MIAERSCKDSIGCDLSNDKVPKWFLATGLPSDINPLPTVFIASPSPEFPDHFKEFLLLLALYRGRNGVRFYDPNSGEAFFNREPTPKLPTDDLSASHCAETMSRQAIGKRAEPAFIEPMQCKPVTELPADRNWTYEIKFDGHRCIAVKRGRGVTLFSRNEKVLNYFHALSRFDKPAEERAKSTLIVLSADEGQEILTAAESAFADHRASGVIREAGATMIIATQAYTSIHAVLDKRHADVLMLNLSNELIFTVANHDSAVIASKNIGEREIVEKSWGWTAGKRSYNYQKKIKPFFEPYQLRNLPRFHAIIRHCEKPFRRRLVPPINPDGTYPEWFVSFRPDYAVRQWLKGKRIPTRH